MSKNTELIIELCNNGKEVSIGKDGGISVGYSEDYRLINNGIKMNELNLDELQVCCVELTKILLIKGRASIPTVDHEWFWSWIGEVLISDDINYLSDDDERPIKNLFCVCIRSALAGLEKTPFNNSEYRNYSIEHNLRQLYMNKSLILAYLSFPLLEGILKKYCNEYVLLSGRVIKDFEVNRGNNNIKKYERYGQYKYINSIEDLLLLFIQKVAGEKLVENLNDILDHIKGLDNENPNNPCKIIYNWRNSSLHGEKDYSTIGGTILNISIIIFLHSIEDKYKQNLSKIQETVLWKGRHNSQALWTFYPPYV